MLQTGANLSSALRWAVVVESSKCKQYTRNKKRFWLIAAMQIGFPSTIFRPNACSTFFGALRSAQEQQDAYGRANFCHACIVHSYTIPLRRFLIWCRALEGQCSPLCTQNDPPLPPIPLAKLWFICLTQTKFAFFPTWIMRSSLVYSFNCRLFLRLEHATWHISTHTAFFLHFADNYLYYMGGTILSIWPRAEININKK